jgi:hypothetical protein
VAGAISAVKTRLARAAQRQPRRIYLCRSRVYLRRRKAILDAASLRCKRLGALALAVKNSLSNEIFVGRFRKWMNGEARETSLSAAVFESVETVQIKSGLRVVATLRPV